MKTSVTVNDKPVYTAATGLKLGPRGKVLPAGTVYAATDKGTARKLRKELRNNGFSTHAAERRLS